MITFRPKTGYGNSVGLIKYVTPWSKEIGGRGSMRFLTLDVRLVIDVTTEDSRLVIFTYPHNDEKIGQFCTELEQQILNAYEQARKNTPFQSIFTMTIEQPAVRLLTIKDFDNYYPSAELKCEMFIFRSKSSEDYDIFVFEPNYRKQFPTILHVFATISHEVMPPSNKPTDVGKEFTYILANSRRKGEYTSETPSLKSMTLPSNDEGDIPSRLNVAELLKIVEQSGADTLTEGGDATIPPLSDKPGGIIPVENNEDVFGKPEKKDLLEIVKKQIVDKAQVNLSDLFQAGLSKVLDSLSSPDKIISVIPDIGGIGSKMCLYKGKFHLIPIYNDDDTLADFFGEPEELFVRCTMDTFPRLALPAPKEYIQ